jgi:hypothetical protein
MHAIRSSQTIDAVTLASGDIHLGELAVSHLPGLGLSLADDLRATGPVGRLFFWRHCLSRTPLYAQHYPG